VAEAALAAVGGISIRQPEPRNAEEIIEL
jgi:hypothetical protein